MEHDSACQPRVSVWDISNNSSNDASPVWDEDDVWAWEIVQYDLEDVLDRIRPLDLILFSGNTLISKTIKMAEKKKYGIGNVSHIGLVIDHSLIPSIKQMNKYDLYIWESTSSKCRNNKLKDIFNKSRFGVQIRNLEEVISCYIHSGGRVFWGKLKNNPIKIQDHQTEDDYKKKMDEIISKMESIYSTYGKSSYNLSIIDLGASIYPWMRPLRSFKNYLQKKNKKSKPVPLFCSEFVAIIYKELGIISGIEPENIVPVDFLGITEKGIPLILKKIIEIQNNGVPSFPKQL